MVEGVEAETKHKKPLPKHKRKGAGKNVKVTIDCDIPAQQGIFNPEDLEKFFHDRIKVNGRAGQLGEAVVITRVKSKILINARPPFTKRYVKYLTKKFLKKHQLRDWLKLIAPTKGSYQIKFFNIEAAEEAAAE